MSICKGSEVFVVKKLQRQLGALILAYELAEGKLVVAIDEKETLHGGKA